MTPSTTSAGWEPTVVVKDGPTFRKPKIPLLGIVGLICVISMVVIAIVGPWFTRDPIKLSADVLVGPSTAHWFGTDSLGRDYFARVVGGTRLSIGLAFVAITISTTLGVAVGVASAYLGGLPDLLIQRVVDVLLAFPGLILVMFLAAVFGASFMALAVSLGLILAPGLSRVVRGSTLSVSGEPYIEAARVLGASNMRIMVRHILPNILAPVIVFSSAGLGIVILAEGGLSFLGLGIAPPTPSWGKMLSESRTQLREPWLSVFPGLAMTIAVLGFNLIGDALRDMLDPRLRTR